MIHSGDVDIKWPQYININLLLRRIYVQSLVSSALLHLRCHTASFLNDFSIGSAFFSILISLLATLASSIMTHPWIWLHLTSSSAMPFTSTSFSHQPAETTHYFIIFGTRSKILNLESTLCRHTQLAAHLFNTAHGRNHSLLHQQSPRLWAVGFKMGFLCVTILAALEHAL